MGPRKLSGNDLSPTDRLILRIEMVEESTRELRRRVLDMESSWIELVPAVADQISNRKLIPALIYGLEHSLQLPASLDAKDIPDRLSLDSIPVKKQKEAG